MTAGVSGSGLWRWDGDGMASIRQWRRQWSKTGRKPQALRQKSHRPHRAARSSI
jgi:transposase